MSQHHCPNCGSQLELFSAFSFGNVSIKTPGQVAYNSAPIALPPTQFLVVDALVRARGRCVTRSMLANLISPDISDKTIVKYINRARDAFRSLNPSFNQIECLKGFSCYRWKYQVDSS
jgi:DNA-binding response OmpR family regulator